MSDQPHGTDSRDPNEAARHAVPDSAAERPTLSASSAAVAASWFGVAIGGVDFVLFELGDRFQGAAESVLTPAALLGLSWFTVHVLVITACTVATGFVVGLVGAVARVAIPKANVMIRLTPSVAIVACAVLGLRIAHQAVPPLQLTLSGLVTVALVAAAFAWERRGTRRPSGNGGASKACSEGLHGVVGVVATLAVIAMLPLGYSTWMRMRPPPEDRDPRPNVLILVLDTVRADSLGCYGSSVARTPTIDRVASEGVQFGQAFATAPWTFPSHASMWTGLYPSEHGATWDHMYLDANLETLAERLARKGYVTVGITENPVTAKELGLAQGFAEYHERWKRTLPVAALELAFRLVTGAPEREEWTETTIRTVTRWIDTHQHDDRPFFMFVNLMAAHLPNYPREPSPSGAWTADDLAVIEPVNRVAERFYLDEHHLDARHLAIMRQIYDQQVAHVDTHLRTVMADLEERDLVDNTIVVITSDHGENFGDHGFIEHQLCVYNSLVRVPLIIRYPRLLDPDSVMAPVSTVDLGRAVESLIEITVAQPGRPVSSSLAGIVTGRESHVGEYGNPVRMLRETLGADVQRIDLRQLDRQLRFIVYDGFKLILGSDGRSELYDLTLDFDETLDLSGDRPEVVRELQSMLDDWDHARPHERMASPAPELDADTLRRLESLGYVAPRSDD